MNILTDVLPDFVEVDGERYKIYSDWRSWVKFQCMFEDDTLSDRERAAVAMKFFKASVPCDTQAAFAALSDFAAGKAMPQAGRKRENEEQAVSKPACFSFVYDAPYVFSAFWQVYGINLREAKDMHWFEFLSLFQGLPDDVPLRQRMQLRMKNPSEYKDSKQRRELLKAQATIAIPQKEMKDADVSSGICSGFFMS